jgi:hypothetical protein
MCNLVVIKEAKNKKEKEEWIFCPLFFSAHFFCLPKNLHISRAKATQVSVVETSLLWWRKSSITFGSSAS